MVRLATPYQPKEQIVVELGVIAKTKDSSITLSSDGSN